MVLLIKLWNVLSLFVVCLYSSLLSSLRYARHATPLHPTLRHVTPRFSSSLYSALRHTTSLHSTPRHATPPCSTLLLSTLSHHTPLLSTPRHASPVQSTIPYPTLPLMTVTVDHTNRARILPVIIKLSLLYTVHFFVYIQDIFIIWFQVLTDIIWPVSVIICLYWSLI